MSTELEGTLLELVLHEIRDAAIIATNELATEGHVCESSVVNNHWLDNLRELSTMLLKANDIDTAFVLRCMSALRDVVSELEDQRENEGGPVTEVMDRHLRLFEAKKDQRTEPQPTA